ncbi:phage integrase family protein [Massilia jejuensis]|uniref:Phage integrase family protein n=1 Tax=Massilia jejuensis TaxID=648894 RepID=A0ABW0PF35_9BURK
MRDTAGAAFEPDARKLHIGHFAFMRAFVQGLDLRDTWERYLAVEGSRTDVRNVRRAVAWMRDAFAAAAHRHRRHALARLVRIDVSKVRDREGASAAAQSLEDFAMERGLEDFSIEDQLAYYQEAYGNGTQKEKRSARLLRRQLDGIAWLEQVASEAPHPDDGVRAWLPFDLAVRLEGAGMVTLRLLVERINGVGRNWHAPVRAVGAGKADRIVAIMRGFHASTGLRIGAHVLDPRLSLDAHTLQLVVPASTAVVPLEKFVVPQDLDGSNGRFRAPRYQCQLAAENDYGALLSFLREKQGRHVAGLSTRAIGGDALGWLRNLGPTARAYRTECERFMLWAILERKKPLSSIDFDDAIAYRAFLADPQPADRWCAPRSRGRWGPAWRPFEGPLEAAAQRRALTMLGTFYRFLVDQRYLTGNPWTGISKPRAPAGAAEHTRSFTKEEWGFICTRLAALPTTSANQRLRVALPLLYVGRLRRAEIVRARLGHLRWTEMPATPDEPATAGWELLVTGKGDKRRLVPLAQVHVDALKHYLASRGLLADVTHPDNAQVHLLGLAVDLQERTPWAATKAVDPRRGINAQTLYDQLKVFFAGCADHLEHVAPQSAAQLRRASTHWLRHTGITHSLAAGTPAEVEMKVAGHASLATTSKYAHAETRRRLQGSAAFLAQQTPIEPDNGAGASAKIADLVK